MNWDEIAARYGTHRCTGCASREHTKGEVDFRGVIHWSDRRVTRPGVRRYLMLIASSRLLGFAAMPEWQRLYAQNTWAAQAAEHLRMRLPRTLSLDDRARVRWLISHEPNVPPSVRRWANRGLPHAEYQADPGPSGEAPQGAGSSL